MNARGKVLFCIALWLHFNVSAQAVTISQKTGLPETNQEITAAATTQRALIITWADDIRSSDTQKASNSLQKLMDWVIHNPGRAAYQCDYWLPILFQTGHYQEIVQGTTKIVRTAADNHLSHLEDVFPFRIKSQLKLGKSDEALVSAKQFYNVCSMKMSMSAISLIADALKSAHPDEPGIADRFQAEQQKELPDVAAFDATKIPSEGSSILDSIKIIDGPQEHAAQLLVKEDYATLNRRGNYALLLDKPVEAKAFFERAYSVAPEKSVSEAVESIARAIRAEHRSVSAANAWISSLKTQQNLQKIDSTTP